MLSPFDVTEQKLREVPQEVRDKAEAHLASLGYKYDVRWQAWMSPRRPA